MGRIQTNIGLMSGIPISDTVDKLIALARRPRDLLAGQNQVLQQQQSAVMELSALLTGVQLAARNLGKTELYNRRAAQSSDPQVVEARVTGSPPSGSVTVRPLRLASQHQVVSVGLPSDRVGPAGAEISWRFGPDLARPFSLADIRGGAGFVPGLIRISDRAGGTATVDLSAAQTIEDVLRLINGQTNLRVFATAEGDRIRLTDLSGGSGRLVVQEVTPGTARSLGLLGINTSEDFADGEDIVFLAQGTRLAALNDGHGVRTLRYLPEIRYHLRDGTVGTVNLADFFASQVSGDELTLGQLLEYVNALAPGKFRLEIAEDGKRLVFRDLTEGAGSTRLEAINGSALLRDLGLDGAPVGATVVGRRLLGGLQSVLVSRLRGGKGLGDLGQIRLRDRSGAEAIVDLAGSETLADILNRINGAGVGLRAELNPWKLGILIRDISHASSVPLSVESVDATETAEKLGLATAGSTQPVASGDLQLQIVSENTPLARLNGGRGVAAGSFTLIDSRGSTRTIFVSPTTIKTVDDLIRIINNSGLSVRAEINPAGDGIRIIDFGLGGERLRVIPRTGTTAYDLGLVRDSQSGELNGQSVQWIDGSLTYRVSVMPGESLHALAARINAVGGGVSATVANDGSSQPWRLVLMSQQPGLQGRIVLTGSTLPGSFTEISPAQDALLGMGGQAFSGAQVVLASSTNKFVNVIPGLELVVKQASHEPVTITVGTSDADVVASVRVLVDAYNRFRSKLAEHAAFDASTGKKGPLFGDVVALRLQTEIPRLLSSAFSRDSRFASLRDLGIELRDDGTLKLDEGQLREALAQDPASAARFFADTQNGFGKKLDSLVEQLAGIEGSLLSERMKALTRKIEGNSRRIADLDDRLRVQRQRLLADFYRLERVIGQMQSQLAVVERLNNLAAYVAQANRR